MYVIGSFLFLNSNLLPGFFVFFFQMDYDYFRSLGFVEHSNEWTNAMHIGMATRLTSQQRSVLIRLRFPDAQYKYAKKTHWFGLRNSDDQLIGNSSSCTDEASRLRSTSSNDVSAGS